MVFLYVLCVSAVVSTMLALPAILLYELGQDNATKKLRKEVNAKYPGLNLEE